MTSSARHHSTRRAAAFPQAAIRRTLSQNHPVMREGSARLEAVEMTPDEAAAAVERYDCPNCDAMAPSPCRTRGGKVASKYHTARFILVPALRDLLEVPVPGGRRPGATWQALPPVAPTAPPIRIGYARCSTKDQELESQLTTLRVAGCTRVFSEKISTRVKVRPELEAALALCRDIKSAAPGQAVVFTVHELKRPARNAAELMTLAAGLQAAGIQLELLTGPLTGIYDPSGLGAMLFAVLAVAAQLDRDYIRDKTLEGQQTAAARDRHGGRPKVIDDDMLTFALALRDKGVPVPDIATKLTIKTGKNTGQHPSTGSVSPSPVAATVSGPSWKVPTPAASKTAPPCTSCSAPAPAATSRPAQ
jgi:DNA invertase Pin-like site-specific DNA recombinase